MEFQVLSLWLYFAVCSLLSVCLSVPAISILFQCVPCNHMYNLAIEVWFIHFQVSYNCFLGKIFVFQCVPCNDRYNLAIEVSLIHFQPIIVFWGKFSQQNCKDLNP